MALAASWQANVKNDLAEFVANKGIKVVNDTLETAKELSCAQQRLIRSKKSRIELLNDHLQKDWEESWRWVVAASADEILDKNGTEKANFLSAMNEALFKGRGKHRNVCIYGPANCGKTFVIQPLKKIFECFVNPACGNFSWLGIGCPAS